MTQIPPASPHPGLGFGQFVALIAATMAVNALAVDIMLPALGQIGTALSLPHPNERQWVISAYLLSFGAAQILYGAAADRYGRKPPLLVSLLLYIAGALLSAASHAFGTLLLARVLMGTGAAGSRVVIVAVVRDCYAGRLMARVMSLAFMIFLLVPILAPSLGQLLLFVLPWRGIFLILAAYAAGILCWIFWRLPETLAPAARRPIALASLAAGVRQTFGNRTALGYMLASTLLTGGIFGFINSAQQLFTVAFHEGRLFTVVFAMIAGCVSIASLINARLVTRLGSRRLSHAALIGFILLSALQAGIALSGAESLTAFALLQMAIMFCFGLMVGNFGAMSMEPLGRIAGAAAAIQGFVSTVGGALIGLLVGQSFDGTPVPLTLGFAVCGLAILAAVLYAEHFRLFRPHDAVAEEAAATARPAQPIPSTQ